MSEPIFGTLGNDTLTGDVGDDIIFGGAGRDYITGGRGADRLYGQAGDDNILISLLGGGRVIANGGSGNDSLYAANGGGPNQSVTLIGGDGNDQIRLDGFATGNIISAGRGDDTVILGSTLGATVTLGEGADKLELQPSPNRQSNSITVKDYRPGTDQFDPRFDLHLSGWDGQSNPFSGGFVRLLASGTDTLLQFDPDGGGNTYFTALRFKNIAPTAFTAADFGGWPTDGSRPADKTIMGTVGDDAIKGTLGADLISGLDGSDTIDGGAGADRLLGGLGNDNIDGSLGDDIIYGGEGRDYIAGGRGADTLYGQAGDDNIIISLMGGGRVIANGGSGNDSLYAANGGGPNQSVTLIGGDGNDQIRLDGFATGNIINAGRGDDTVILGSTLGATVTLGEGADKLELQPNFNRKSNAIIINDYRPGIDQFDPRFDVNLYGWNSKGNPFSGGFVRLVASGSDTLLQFDPNGGGNAFVTAVRFKNIAPGAFGAADFGGWPTDGSTPAGKAIIGKLHHEADGNGSAEAITIAMLIEPPIPLAADLFL